MKQILLIAITIAFAGVFGNQAYAQTYHHSDGSSTTKVGNSYLHSDGSSTTKVGNSYLHSDGSSTTKIGKSDDQDW